MSHTHAELKAMRDLDRIATALELIAQRLQPLAELAEVELEDTPEENL